MPLSPNSRLGRYQVRSLLGKGGMGEVYLAEDTSLKRLVAIKLLPDDVVEAPLRLRRFEREAHATSSLNHPNILTIYEIGEAEGHRFIASEYVEGENLRQHMARRQMSLKRIVDTTIQVASALAAAEHEGIVHRDIKPENIMLRKDGYVKVLDFGLAKLVNKAPDDRWGEANREAQTITMTSTSPGIVMGTVAYMSPEQARGKAAPPVLAQEQFSKTSLESLPLQRENRKELRWSPMSKLFSSTMPFGNLMSPSIGLGLLKGALMEAGIRARTFHFEVGFARLIGEQNYERIYGRTRTEQLAGEFIFATSLFGPQWGTDVEQYVNEVLKPRATGSEGNNACSEALLEDLASIILTSREKVEGFLLDCLETIVSLHPKVVGFTSLFHQHVSSLSLSKRIKEQLPNTFIVFGGSNCEGPMGHETVQQFEFVDAVVSGEGEFVFPEIVRRVLNSEPVPILDGIFRRRHSQLPIAHQRFRNTPTIENLDSLPLPDYDDYFEQLSDVSVDLPARRSLLFETSRGCWWGEKQHCTFCGLNGDTMAYRSKSEDRAFSEFVYLTEKYPASSVSVVDNILDMSYFKHFIPLLAKRKHGLNLFYEVKANLRKDQLLLLREAGIREIQPGIESLSDNVLRIMRKGVSALQNLQLMKWCKELGLHVYYNLIWGFPGERADDYLKMTQLIPLITHLKPPFGVGKIRIDRFSPNFEQGESLGLKNLSPHPAYRYVYPFGPDVLFNLAYYFTPEDDPTNRVTEYANPFAEEIKRWKDCHSRSDLFWMEKGERLLIWDFRPVARERLTVLTGCEKFSYMACDHIRTPRQVVELWRAQSADTATEEADVREALDSLVEQGLMVGQENSYLALAYPKR
jgi:ribosomal peptide maturation radical SAM protein 1